MLTGVAEVLRCLINAVQVFPGERGVVHVSLRGNLAAFLQMAVAKQGRAVCLARNNKTPGNASVVRGLSRLKATWDAGDTQAA